MWPSKTTDRLRGMGATDQGSKPGRDGWVIPTLLLLGVCTSAFHGTWFARDDRIPFMDQHRYYEMSRKAATVFNGSSEAGPMELLHLHASHPPLYPMVGALGILAGGDGYRSARLVNVPLAFLLVIAIYGLARCILSPSGALLASALGAWAPLVSSFGHVYYIESLLVVLVILALRMIVNGAQERQASAVTLGLLLGLGCLAKWTFPVFLAAPIIAVMCRGHLYRGALTTAATAAVIAAPWYVVNFQGLLDFFASGVAGGEGHLSAHEGWSGLLYYPRKIVLTGLGLPLSLAAAGGLLLLLRRNRKTGFLILLTVVVPVIVFGFVMSKKPRHLIPILPVLATSAAFVVMAIPRPLWRRLAGAFLVLHVGAASFQSSFHVLESGLSISIDQRRISLLSEPSPIPGAPDATRWPYRDILNTLVAADARRETPVLLLVNLMAFREDGFWYWRDEIQRDVEVGLVPFSYPEGHPAWQPFPMTASAQDTPGLLDAGYLLLKTGVLWNRYETGHRLHRYGAWIADGLMDPGGPLRKAFEPIGEWPLADGSRALAFRARSTRKDFTRELATWALRHAPECEEAWRVLEEPVPLEPQRDRRLAQLGIRPSELAVVTESSLATTLQRHQDREDLWRLAAARFPESDIGREAATVLDLILATRTREREPDAALHLSDLHARAGRRIAAVRWLRRALEGNGELEHAVRDRMVLLGIEEGSQSVLDRLRQE